MLTPNRRQHPSAHSVCTSSEPRHSGGTRDRRTVSTKITVRLVSLTDAPAEVTAETNLPRHQAGQVSIFFSYVEHRGFEPLTYCLQSSRATNCANAPWTRTV